MTISPETKKVKSGHGECRSSFSTGGRGVNAIVCPFGLEKYRHREAIAVCFVHKTRLSSHMLNWRFGSQMHSLWVCKSTTHKATSWAAPTGVYREVYVGLCPPWWLWRLRWEKAGQAVASMQGHLHSGARLLCTHRAADRRSCTETTEKGSGRLDVAFLLLLF